MMPARRWWPEHFLPRAIGWLDRRLQRLTAGRVRLHLYYLVAQPVPDEALLPPGRGRKIDVRDVTGAQSESLDFPRPRHVIRQRFANGGQCLGAFREERLIGFLWLQRDAYDEDEVRCLFLPTPPERAAWDYDVYVDPDFRFSAAFGRLWDEAFTRLRGESIRWTMSRVAATNLASLASHGRLQARIVGAAFFLRLGRTQLTLSSCRPFVHFSPAVKSRPRIIVRAPSE